MGSEPKRASARQKRSPAKGRRSQSRAQNAEASLHSSSTTSSPNKTETPRTARYSHRLPTDQQRKGNGRVAGRSLIIWNRPRMAEKLLLHIQYECSRHKIALPWDAIAHRLHPGSSGQAVCQHINRLRRELVAEGHLVPPLPQKSGSFADPEIRGFTRKDVEGNDLETTRAVTFDERVDDPRFSLPDAVNLSAEDSEDLEDVEEMEGSEGSSSPDPIQRELPSSPTPVRGGADGVAMESSALPDVKPAQFRFVTQDRRPSPVGLHRHLIGGDDDDTELESRYSQQSAHASETSSSLFTESTSPSHSFASTTMTSDLASNAQRSIHGQPDYRLAGGARPWAYQHPYYTCTAPNVPSPAVSFEHAEYFAPPMPPPIASAHYAFYVMDPSTMRPGTQDRTTLNLASSPLPPLPPPPPQEPVSHIGHIGGPMEELFPGLDDGDGKIADSG